MYLSACTCCVHTALDKNIKLKSAGLAHEYDSRTWAARYNTGLLIKLTPQGVVFSFLFFFVQQQANHLAKHSWFACLKQSHARTMLGAVATWLHRPYTCHLQDGKLHFQQHAINVLQVWVRDVLEAQQVLDYRTGQRFKKSEVPTLLDIFQHRASCDYPVQSLQPGMTCKCMLAAGEPACLRQLQWLNICCIAYRQTGYIHAEP